ncbi:MAG TPA: SCO family protein [Usitatibacteraceae bacterium]|nr:SCO family protein [Usitatibacteraceae bacterium]
MISRPRLKLVAIMALFALPIVASTVAYRFFRPEATANYGELLVPPAPITTAQFLRAGGGTFRFEELRGKWVLIASDSGACPASCTAKLTMMRQVRLMLGRNAARVVRVFVADDTHTLEPGALAPYEGTVAITPPPGTALPSAPVNDRAHFYLADPLGNVMMRFPEGAEPRPMLRDLERLLKASQIG